MKSLACVLALGACLTVGLQASAARGASIIAPLPAPIRTQGRVATRAGAAIAFVAEAGLLRVRGDSSAGAERQSVWNTPPPDPRLASASAAMSYYAYTAQPAGQGLRPLIFVWDGGPGTSTRTMLLNSFGPVLSTAHDAGPPASSPFRENPDTLLDVADVVFVDAPGTGFGRIETPGTERAFFGVNADATVFQRFIEAFVRIHHREGAPIALLGESYGCVRAVVVARRLEEAGQHVALVGLISPPLSLDAWSDGFKANVGTENGAFLTLPSYAAAAWVHGKTPRIGAFADRMREVERFSLRDYAPALLLGADLSRERRDRLAQRLAAYTGVSATAWLQEDLRMEASRFRDLLEADQGRIVGREDTRADGPAPKTRHDPVSDDPALKAKPPGPGPTAFDAYVRGVLGFGDQHFQAYTDEDPDNRWDMGHVAVAGGIPGAFLNVAPDLGAVLKADAETRVVGAGGYFDLATPYFQTPYLISHMSEAARARISWKVYEASHSVYEVPEARRDLHDRIAASLTR